MAEPQPDRDAAGTRPRVTRVLLWLAVAIVCLAVVGNVVRASRQGWVLESDNAAIAVNSFDTVHGHPRLLGVHSSAVSYAGIGDFWHPGPLEYWVAALPAGLFGWSTAGFLFTAALLNGAAVIGVAVFARRRAGDGFALATMLATSVLLWGLGPEVPHDIWNPHIAVLPWLLALMLLWSVGEGDRAALVPLAFVASFSVQNHFSYLPLVGPLTVAVLVLLRLRLRAARREAPDRWARERRRWLVAAGAALGVGVLVWSPVVIQQLTGTPGNISQLVRFVRQGSPSGRRGFGWGIGRLEGFLGARPVWLDRNAGFFTISRLPSTLDALVTAVLLAAAVAVLVHHARRGRPAIARLLGLLLGALVLQVIATASLPREISSSLPYNYGPWWPLCALLWLAVIWGAVQATSFERARRALASRRVLFQAAGLAAVVVFAVAVVAGTTIANDHGHEAFPAIRRINAGLRSRLPSKGPWYVAAQGGLAIFSLQHPVVLDLVRHGYDARIPAENEIYLGTFRRVDPRHLAGIILVTSGAAAETPHPGAKVLLRIEKPADMPPPPGELAYPVVVSLLPPDRLASVTPHTAPHGS
ncbi:MAG: hypothetical protein JWN46_312 [Acidimicrobiales bacterium]|nr:hypothetical protein [Acidimicrobiales bacterium]